MSKIKYLLVALLFVPITVFAASTPRVLTLTGSINNKVITYNGTIDGGSTAVMCKLYDSSDNEIDILSSPVDDTKFSGTFNVSKNGKYKIACAHYSGGEIKEVTVGSSQTVETTSSNISKASANPKTYDAGIKSSMIVFAISFFGMIGSSLYLKKKKNK